ncbi:hypothetical protein [Herbaspirillum sp. YR522]|nr:hypothetical protein [Herbaspirillum sp. YR522]EJN06640.1 hypothetical protein PMI40_02206 [Herbaspirillum sp. YR522]
MNLIELIMSYGAQALIWYVAYVLIGSFAFGAYVWRSTSSFSH